MKSGNESEDWRTVRERPSGAMDMQDRLEWAVQHTERNSRGRSLGHT